MKKIILISLFLLGTLFSSIAQNKTDNEFKTHLTMIYEHYINLKSAFIKSDVEAIIAMAKEVQRELPNVEKASALLENKKVWVTQSIKIESSINAILKVKDIEKQRIAFAVLSEALYQSIKTYGVLGMKSYYQYCPMALNGKGAYWLSLQEEIQNPYFGDKMITCGKTKEIIE